MPSLLQTEDYARAILSVRPDGNLDGLDEQVAARLARQAVLDVIPAAWRTSSYSGDNGGTCVEVGTAGPAVAVRDSNHPDGPLLTFAVDPWQAFTEQVKRDSRLRP